MDIDEHPLLPTPSEARASKILLSDPRHANRVVRVGDYAIKYGPTVTIREADNMVYLDENSEIPVPRALAVHTDTDGINYIVMDYIHGRTIDQCWDQLSPKNKDRVQRSLRYHMTMLRKMPSPGFIGSIDQTCCADPLFNPPTLGRPHPTHAFADKQEMGNAIFNLMVQCQSGAVGFLKFMYDTLMPTFTETTRRTCFTHANLRGEHIMVTEEPETNKAKIVFIGWKAAGWYPEFWEYCNAVEYTTFTPVWLELARNALTEYRLEFLAMTKIRRLQYFALLPPNGACK